MSATRDPNTSRHINAFLRAFVPAHRRGRWHYALNSKSPHIPDAYEALTDTANKAQIQEFLKKWGQTKCLCVGYGFDSDDFLQWSTVAEAVDEWCGASDAFVSIKAGKLALVFAHHGERCIRRIE